MKQKIGYLILSLLLLQLFPHAALAHWEGGEPYPWYLELAEWGIIIVGLFGTLILVLRKKPDLDDQETDNDA